jgi:hypothetical protein
MTDAAPAPSFANDIAPILYKYRGQMAWRLDLANYQDVVANAAIIYGQIQYDEQNPPGMPPPPFPPFSLDFVALFNSWMNTGYQP